MPALHRAIAFPQVDEIAVLIAEDLHFDVLGAADVAFDENFRAAERAAGFALGLFQSPA